MKLVMADCARFRLERAFFTALLWFHVFVDFYLAVALQADHAMHGLTAGHRNVDHIVAWIEKKIYRRCLVDHPAVHRNLSAFGLRLDRDLGHPRTLVSSEQLAEFPHSLDLVGNPEHLKDGREFESLTGYELSGCGFIEITLLADQDGVISLLRSDLRRRDVAAVFTVDKN